ncbi:MAG: hypothetical protein Kow0063_18650 [Anaerolineae bacterium]
MSDRVPSPEEENILGLTAFDSLRAEDEPWLDECFVLPPGMDQITGDGSSLIFGVPGSGKTALYQHLLRCSLGPDGRPRRLIVPWRPSPGDQRDSGGLAAERVQMAEILDTCVTALLTHLTRYPDSLQAMPPLARETLAWFAQGRYRGETTASFPRLVGGTTIDETLLRSLLETPAPDVLYPDASPEQMAAELIEAIVPLGLEGIWVMADGLEAWAELAYEELVAGLKAFLSTLPLFERPHFSYKLFIPADLEPALAGVSAVIRRRVAAHYLRWDVPSLRCLVEQRLALATGQNDLTLEKLCSSPKLIPWLEKVGPDSPREWLDQLQPLVKHYLSHHLREPVDEKTWYKLRKEHPPRIYVDEAGKRVLVGARQISLEDVPPRAYDILRYLYQQPGGRVVSKAELYFLAYLGLDHLPRTPGDEGYEARKEYEGVIDTNLWRLRQAIEPDPSVPVLLVTVRGHGVQLKARW